jgi:hypothetical protein
MQSMGLLGLLACGLAAGLWACCWLAGLALLACSSSILFLFSALVCT